MGANRREDTCSKIIREPIGEMKHVAGLLVSNRREDTCSKIIRGPIGERIREARLFGGQ